MPIPISSLSSPTLKIPSFSPFFLQTHYRRETKLCSLPTKIQPSRGRYGLLYTRKLGFCVKAETGGVIGDENSARGESTMPDRFKYLSKEAPDPPVRWPWFVGMGFLVYAWRAVLFELANWKKGAFAIVGFVGYLLKLLLALIFHFIGDPITSLIRCIETSIYTVRAFYSGIVAYAPIPELTMIIMLASIVLAVGEATVPNCVSSQPYLLTLSGIIGYAAVKNYISEPLFWALLLSLYGFSRLVKRRDDVTSALPAVAVLAAVGEPWVRFSVMIAYLVLAISHHSKKLSEGNEQPEVVTTGNRVPLPLVCAALSIGIRLAANWAGYRHLTWMIA